MSESPTSSPNRYTRTDLILLVLAALVVVGFRLHAYPAPLESDECNYAYFAQRMLAGDRLYVDLWDHQPPGIFAALILPTAVFGSSPAVYRTLAVVLVLVTMLGVFDLARRWFGRSGAWTATMLFAVVSSDPGVGGEGCNREVYLNALLVAAWWVLARGTPATLWRVFAAGLLIGLASTIKTVVALHWVALVPVLLIMPAPRAGASLLRHLESLAAFAAGPAAIWLVILGYFAMDGRVEAFVDAAFAHNLVYSHVDQGWGQRLVAFFQQEKVFGTALALWLAGLFGFVALPWRGERVKAAALAAFAIGSYLAVCLPGRFWPHYYMLMLPPVVLLAGGLVHRVELFHPRLSFGVGAAILLALLSTEIPGYLLVEPDRIALDRYGVRMIWVRDQAKQVATVTDPQDSIYVWSSDAGFYYYAGRRCASRFTMYTALVADHPSTRARRRLLLEDLERNQPRLIILPAKPPFAELHQFFLDHKYITVGRTERMEVLCDLERPIARIDWRWGIENEKLKMENGQ